MINRNFGILFEIIKDSEIHGNMLDSSFYKKQSDFY